MINIHDHTKVVDTDHYPWSQEALISIHGQTKVLTIMYCHTKVLLIMQCLTKV